VQILTAKEKVGVNLRLQEKMFPGFWPEKLQKTAPKDEDKGQQN
jgi:hypothetical protein